ncbi:GntR family transcriptional regulator [Nonomuraea wenchangensis]|uniref:GntR family transcriptional regulator n=1 Tax=Nonomuraea wenchangensis TaxID=568860 RepID=A0A1I0LT34_9ACTN|nr:GntR family transcriptional regulator [Nonomuraea wenchangensis]SEU46084.1 GntR family transcriptional regulator [Nonomuraea wenchangensis]
MTSGLGGFAPKYQQIAEALRRDIQEGRYQPGERLPAETALAERFKVSLPTIRQAVGVLRSQGIVESKHGIGTFVRQDHRLERRSRCRYGRARSDGKLLTSHLRHDIVFAGTEQAPARIAEAMGISEGTEVITRRRVLYDKETNTPEEIGASYIPADIARGTFLEKRDVVPKALFLCVEDLSGKRYHHARDQWIARSATPEEIVTLGLPQGGHVMHVIHTARAEDDTVLEVSESIWPADRVTIIDEYLIDQEANVPDVPSQI